VFSASNKYDFIAFLRGISAEAEHSAKVRAVFGEFPG
jgi:hypothetical protein